MSDLATSLTWSGRRIFWWLRWHEPWNHGLAMMLRAAAAALFAIAATAATASAQAPGDVPLAPPGEVAPSGAPGMIVVAPARPSVMANRWAIGLSVGSLSLAPKATPDDKTDFGVGELSLRFRATLHLELELAVGGGRQNNPDGTQGNLEAHTGMLDLRYRFAAEDHWNWWIMGGIGGISVVPYGATGQQVNDANRSLGMLGIGVEHRWSQFAIHAELSAVGVGPSQNANVQPVVSQPPSTTGGAPAPGTTTTQPMPPPPAPAPGMTSTPDDRLSGGQFTIGASYYF